MPSRTKGELGEALAAQYLEVQGWRMIARNYRCPWGEIDLICEKEQFLVFAEVKARTGVRYGLPREAVTLKKQERIKMTASLWLSEHPTDAQPRFDVLEVYLPSGRINHLENAFW